VSQKQPKPEKVKLMNELGAKTMAYYEQIFEVLSKDKQS